jgi:hypothetical protein
MQNYLIPSFEFISFCNDGFSYAQIVNDEEGRKNTEGSCQVYFNKIRHYSMS